MWKVSLRLTRWYDDMPKPKFSKKQLHLMRWCNDMTKPNVDKAESLIVLDKVWWHDKT